MLDWHSIVCCLFLQHCCFHFVRHSVSIVVLLTLLCCAFFLISTVILYAPDVEIKMVVLSRCPAGRPRPSVPHKAPQEDPGRSSRRKEAESDGYWMMYFKSLVRVLTFPSGTKVTFRYNMVFLPLTK